MREIKFRAWNGETMEYDPPVPCDWKLNEFFRDEGDFLMQFTGLNDENGREIYEGDIVREFTMYPGVPIQIFWDQKTISWYGKLHGTREIRIDKRNYEFEVIGNVYENPELLAGTPAPIQQ